MNVSIYNKELDRVDVIENRFVSCFWSEGYNTTEPFTLELQESDAHKKNVRPGFYVGRSDRKALMVITTVESRDGKIVVSGKQATRVLDDVAFVGKIEAGQSIDKSVINAYNSSSKCVDLDFDDTDLGISYDEEIENASILSISETMCQSKDVGLRVIKNGKRLKAQFYRPTNNDPYRMSKGFGNVDVNAIILSIENLRNYAIVLGQDANGKTVRVDVDETDGEDRKEIILNTGETPKDGENTTKFTNRLRSIGHEKLVEYRRTWSANFQPVGGDFGVRYDLGDFVVLVMPDYGLKFEARVTRFQQIEQNNSIKTSISIGEITTIRRKR